jgi:hypothetical protein
MRKNLTQGNDYSGYSIWPLKNNYNHMKSSMTQSDTHWYDYRLCEIPCPTTGGHMAAKNKL